jgi:membrane protein DedA with SNARE-associated domain
MGLLPFPMGNAKGHGTMAGTGRANVPNIWAEVPDGVLTWLSQQGYWALFFGMALESAAVPLPSEVILPFGGYLVATHRLHLLPAIAAAVLGGMLGSVALYAVGRYGGRPALHRYGRYVLLRPSHLDAADRFFARYGALSVFLGRLLPGVRTYISLPAGIADMPWAPFVAYSFLGSVPWTVALVLLGRELGAHWQEAGHALTPVYLLLAALVLALLAWALGHRPASGRRG